MADPGDWVSVMPMPSARGFSAASVLPSGKLLVAGGIRVGQQVVADAAIYDPATDLWQAIAPIPIAHRFSAQLLDTGDVLIVGDDDINDSIPPSSFLYNENAGWSQTTGAPSIKRYQPALALLTTGAMSGHVLMTGGYNNQCCAGPSGTFNTTEFYNPTTKSWSAGPTMNVARLLHTATVLNDGRVLVVGGALRDPLTAYNSAELYTSGGNSWTPANSMAAARYGHTATRLPSGEVLVVGGANGTAALNSVELYSPASGLWSIKMPMTTARHRHTATLLPSGKVLVAGGEDINGVPTDSAELYDPANDSWSNAGPLNGVRGRHIAALLSCGRVLVAGGMGTNGNDLASAEIYTQKDPFITITPTTLSNGTVGQTFMQNFLPVGGMAPFTYSQPNGDLPKGMTLQSDGKVTGIPEEKGSFTFTVKATDKNGCMGTVTITWQVDCPSIVISPATVHSGVAGQNYLPIEQLTATGGTAPYSYAVTAGMLPNGMTLTSDGKLQGTPMESGNFSFQVTATDKFGCTGLSGYRLTIVCDTITIGPESMQLRDAMQGMEYNETAPPGQTFMASGGCGQYTYAISDGQLPPGMSLTSFGALTGVPTQDGDYEFTVKVTDKCGCMATKLYKLKVTCPFRSLLNTKLFNTGIDGTVKPLPTPTPDPHYSVTYGSTSATPLAVKEYEGWIPNTSVSQWISPFADHGEQTQAANYIYRTFFSLDECDPASARIEGRWAADNSGEIWFNGVKVSGAAITVDTGFKQWQSFTIDATTATSGFGVSNTIEFRVKNDGGPTGLRVEFLRAFAKCCGCVPPPRNADMISWWPLDGNANDIRGGFNGTPKSPGGAYTPGMVNQGWRGNPDSQIPTNGGYVEVPDNPGLSVSATNSFSLDAWIYIEDFTDCNTPIVWKGNQQGETISTSVSLLVTGNNAAQCSDSVMPNRLLVLFSDGTIREELESNVPLVTKRWTHVATTVSPTEVKLYIDGVLRGMAARNPNAGQIQDTTFPLQIGAFAGGTSVGEHYFNGIIDEVEFWRTALTEDEIRNIYSAFSDGKCKCVTAPQSNHLVGWWPMDELSGATVVKNIGLANDGQPQPGGTVGSTNDPAPINGMVNGAFYFDGLTPNGNVANVKHVRVPANTAYDFTGNSFTIDAWINPDLPPSNKADAFFPIVDKLNYTPPGTPQNNTGYAFYVTGTQLVLDMGNNNGAGLSGYASALNVIAPTGWQHVAVVVTVASSGTTGRFYINGQPSTAFNVTSASPNNTLDLLIGKSRYNPPYRAGAIDELEIFNTALTAAEVFSIYEAKGAGKCKPPCVGVNITLTSNPSPIPMGMTGVPYPETQLIASGGAAPYMYTATGLPAGLSLSMDGKITGTPTQQGNSTFTVTVKDANGCTAEIRREIVIKCSEFTIKPDFLPVGYVGTVYPKQIFTTDSPCQPVTYSINGTLPPGLTFTNGMLQGTPTQAGSFSVTIVAVDSCGCSSRKTYPLVIKDCPRVMLKLFNTGVDNNRAPMNLAMPDGHYVATGTNGGVAVPSVIDPLPNWVMSPGARWIGKTQPGINRFSTTFDLSGCDLTSVSISGKFAANVGGQLFLNNSTTPIATNNGPTSFTNFTINSGFQAGPNTLTFVVTPGPSINGLLVEFSEAFAKCCECPAITIGPNVSFVGNLNQPFNPASLTASGGMAPYSYSIIGGALPTGMNLSSAGVLSGTPTVAGLFKFKVLVVDAMNCTGMREYQILIRRRLIGFDYNVSPNQTFAPDQSNRLTLRINMEALGNEKAWSFSLGFNPAALSNPRVTLGTDATGGTLSVNTSQLAQGAIGMAVTLPGNQTLASGSRHIFNVVFDYTAANTGAKLDFEFRDAPVARSVTDTSGAALPSDVVATPVLLAQPATSVSAASYGGTRIAPEQIVAVFGINLATSTQVATSVPLPTTLAGTTIKVRDSANVERLAPLFFVAPTQINYLIPAGTAAGTATILITSGNGTVSGSVVEIADVAPGIFVADASGRGLPAANALTYKPDGSSSSSPVARFDLASSRFVAVPIDLGAIGDRVFLSLFGTGVRRRSSLEAVRAIIGGVEAPLQFVGDQGGFAGLDQINIELPRSLAGSGLVDVLLIVDGQIANVVQVSIR